MNVEPTLKGSLAETAGSSRLRGSLARTGMSGAELRETEGLRGKGLEIGQNRETIEPPVYTSLKNGKSYQVIGYIDRTERGMPPLVRLRCIEDSSTVNLGADSLDDAERFSLKK